MPAPGFVLESRMDGPDRILTFSNVLSARELIVDADGNNVEAVCTA